MAGQPTPRPDLTGAAGVMPLSAVVGQGPVKRALMALAVDLLLDVAASGVNVVAREGVTVSHPAELLLVGTMNPEEGELRPQLQDRFGLCVPVSRLEDPAQRAEIVARCLDFEDNPRRFCAAWAAQEQALARTVLRARELLPAVALERRWLEAAAHLALELAVDGHREEILLVKCARALAALDGRAALGEADLEQAAGFVFAHRLRRKLRRQRPRGLSISARTARL